jgi:hypothetical protein
VKVITQTGQKLPLAPVASQMATHTSDAVAEPPASWARHIKNVVGVASKAMPAEDDFDLCAAGLRTDGSDLRISVAVLASKLDLS